MIRGREMKEKQMKEKQQWSNEHLKCLLETCIEEVNNVGKKGFSLHKDSWKKLGRVLKEKFDMDLTQKQMRNAYDNLKAKYIGWVHLKNKTSNIYNPQTKSFTLTPGQWEEFRKEHPKAASLKTLPLPFPELCATLFDGKGNSALGNLKWTSTQTTSGVGSSTCHLVQPLQIYNPFNDIEDDDDTSPQTSAPTPEPASCASADSPSSPDAVTTPNIDRPNKRAKTLKPSAPSTTAKTSTNDDDLALDKQKALHHLVKSKEGPTVDECYEKLKLVELEPIDPLFLAAFYIFGVSMTMREAWMMLPAIPEVLKGWIKMTATGFGLLK